MNDVHGIDCPCGEGPCARDPNAQWDRGDLALFAIASTGKTIMIAFAAFVAVRVFRALAG